MNATLVRKRENMEVGSLLHLYDPVKSEFNRCSVEGVSIGESDILPQVECYCSCGAVDYPACGKLRNWVQGSNSLSAYCCGAIPHKCLIDLVVEEN